MKFHIFENVKHNRTITVPKQKVPSIDDEDKPKDVSIEKEVRIYYQAVNNASFLFNKDAINRRCKRSYKFCA